MNPTKEKEDDTQEILPVSLSVVQEVGPPIDDGCQGLPAAPGEYSKSGIRNADGTCTVGVWGPK